MFNNKFNSVLSRRHGLSLIEIMIAMVMTLIVLGAMMAAFSYGSAEMQKGRASIELNNRLIAAEEILRRDLNRITVKPESNHLLPSLPNGYLEIVEGPQTDFVPGNAAVFSHGGNEMVFGDRDDYFACTIQSDGKAFRGRQGDQIIQSPAAEVAWFTVPNTSTPDPTDALLIRRQLLILPTTPTAALFSSTNTVLANRESEISEFIKNNDVSVRVVRTAAEHFVFANTLTDLALRGNRFCHTGSLESIYTDPNRSPRDSLLNIAELENRYDDEHVVSSSIAAFDIKVFAPDAYSLFVTSGSSAIVDIASPGGIAFGQNSYSDDLDGTAEVEDAIFDALDRNAANFIGDYVDIGQVPGAAVTSTPVLGTTSNAIFGYNPTTGALGTTFNGHQYGFRRSEGPLSSVPTTPARPPLTTTDVMGMEFYETYDTGTSRYNRRVANHPGSNGVDDLTIDDTSTGSDPPNGIIDDAEELIIGGIRYETVLAPYNTSIEGISFTTRVIEPNTKQVRQLTVKKSFVAQ